MSWHCMMLMASAETVVNQNKTIVIATEAEIITPTTATPGQMTVGTEEKDALWMIHQGKVSKKQFELSAFVLNAILRPIVCILGLVGNIMGIGVLFRKELRQSTYWYLCGINLSDTLYLVCSLIESLPSIFKKVDAKLSEYLLAYSFPYINAFLSLFSFNTSAWLIVVLSVERFIAVRSPFLIKNTFIHRRSFLVCILTFAIVLVYYALSLSIFETKEYYSSATNTTVYTFGYTEWSDSSGFRVIYGMVGTVLGLYIPLLLVCVMNIGIIVQTRLMRLTRLRSLTSHQPRNSWREQTKLTTALIMISIFYFVSVAPRAVIVTMSKFDMDYTTLGKEHFLLYLVLDIAALCSALNAANDFIIYYLVSDVIRNSFRDRYGCLIRKEAYRISQSKGNTSSESEPTELSEKEEPITFISNVSLTPGGQNA